MSSWGDIKKNTKAVGGEKKSGRNPRLNVGQYRLCVTDARLVREDPKEYGEGDSQRYTALVIKAKILEASGQDANMEGTDCDIYFNLAATKGWQKEKEYERVRSFIERATGDDIDDVDLDDLIEKREIRGVQVIDQVMPNSKRPEYPEHSFVSVEQTMEDVEAMREKFGL